MDAVFEADLSPALRLALAWAPPRGRDATLALFALDTRLAGFLRRGGEPLPIQLRLAWWRDMLGSPTEAWPHGDPLLDRLRGWRAPQGLAPLIDGWESLLAESLDESAVRGFALGREKAWRALAREIGAEADPAPAARIWALADLAANLSAPVERERVIAEASGPDIRLPRERALRPLTVLAGLGRRALRRGGAPLLEGRSAALLALRLGMFGR